MSLIVLRLPFYLSCFIESERKGFWARFVKMVPLDFSSDNGIVSKSPHLPGIFVYIRFVSVKDPSLKTEVQVSAKLMQEFNLICIFSNIDNFQNEKGMCLTTHVLYV
jgi:hypothetical protein